MIGAFLLIIYFRLTESATGTTYIRNEAQAQTFYLQGNQLYREGDLESAKESYRTAILYDDKLKYAWTNLGNLLLQTNHYSEAIDAYTQASLLAPDEAKSHYNLGVALQRANRMQESINHYLKGLELQPNYPSCLFNLAIINQDSGDLQTAAKLYTKILKQDPLQVEARLNYCNILFAQQIVTGAERCYQDVLRVDPNYVRGLVNLAAFYMSQPPTDDESINPSRNHQNSADNVVATNSYEIKAVELYEKALSLEPSNVMAKHGMAALRPAHTRPHSPVDGSSSGGTSSSTGSASSVSNENTPAGDTTTTTAHAVASSGRSATCTSSMDPSYVAELFDSYSFHFDQSLVQLNYQSHLLVADAVNRHYFQQMSMSASITTGVPISKMPLIQVLDLGAGTGLVCEPLRQAFLDTMTTLPTQQRQHANLYNDYHTESNGESSSDIEADGNSATVTATATAKATAKATANVAVAVEVATGSTRTADEQEEQEQVPVLEEELEEHSGTASSSSSNNSSMPFMRLLNITAVDLSAKMLQKAAAKDCYNGVVTTDILDYLRTPTSRPFSGANHATITADITSSTTTKLSQQGQDEVDTWDILMAADVFMYFGALEEILALCWGRLRPGGLLVFTVEELQPLTTGSAGISTGTGTGTGTGSTSISSSNNSADQQDVTKPSYQLQKSGRFAHSSEYITNLLLTSASSSKRDGSNGFNSDASADVTTSTNTTHTTNSTNTAALWRVLESQSAVPRRDKGKPVAGLLFVCQKL